MKKEQSRYRSMGEVNHSSLMALHRPRSRCPLRAVDLVKAAPQYGHSALTERPAFSL